MLTLQVLLYFNGIIKIAIKCKNGAITKYLVIAPTRLNVNYKYLLYLPYIFQQVLILPYLSLYHYFLGKCSIFQYFQDYILQTFLFSMIPLCQVHIQLFHLRYTNRCLFLLEYNFLLALVILFL